jgi:SAM-dependent methyltransferase
MPSTDLVRRYFDREARRFDAIYEERKPLLGRLANALFRRVVVERFRLICNLAPYRGHWTVLDVGCGPGRYVVELARRGASRVVGIDVSAQMVELARAEVARAGVGERCEFLVGDFVQVPLAERFDVVVATGYFDYLANPLTHLRLMVEHCDGRLFASFPKRLEPRVPLRKLRFWLARGYVRFYGRGEVERLFEQAGVTRERLSLIDLGRDLIAVARVG